jgi:DNA-binding transcriptional MocR family regulator
MSAERRETLAGIARRHGVCIVEDDPYGPLVEHRPRPLSSFAPERSFYATTFTKSLMPGLRTGYLVAPQNAVPRVLSRLRATSWMATPLIAEIASQWIGDGTADRLIDWQREEMRSREKALERELRGAGCVYRRNALHAWLPVPEQWRVDAFVAGLRQRNVAVTPAELFVVGREAQPDCVRLCLGATRNRSQFEQGLRLIRETLARNPEPVFVET